MDAALHRHSFSFPKQKGLYQGKVRDVYDFGEELLMVTSDRISAFDHILPQAIPYKGQVLNTIASYFLENTEDIVPNWLNEVPDPNVAYGLKCEPIKIEMVIRGYLAGHAWREYRSGKRSICGVEMPEGMKQNDAFNEPIITPATKADQGHDEDISREDIIRSGIVSRSIYEQLEYYTKALFKRGTEMGAKRGLILVDTKYEFGLRNGKVVLIDEIHTPDSSRYFYKEGYEERQLADAPQRQLSKEFVREWLRNNGFEGKEGQEIPTMPESLIEEISSRYIALCEQLTGQPFEKADVSNITHRIEKNVLKFLSR